MAQPTHRYILAWSQLVTPKVLHLGFRRQDGSKPTFIAGQFITLNIPSPNDPNKMLHRSYSIANIPGGDLLEIACAHVEGGVATQLLFNLKPGDEIVASGPYGLFTLKDEQPNRYILIATGTGVTPYRSMIQELQNRLTQITNLHAEVILGVRTPKDLLFGEDFIRLANSHPKFRFSACYSRQVEKPLDTFERKGHVQDLFPELNLHPQSDIIYLCGNPNMIDEAFAALTAAGFDRKSVRREKYLFSH